MSGRAITHRVGTLSAEPRRQSARGLPCKTVEVVHEPTGQVVFTGTLAQAQHRIGGDDTLAIRTMQGPPRTDLPSIVS
jgi:hypothetical protein